MKNEPFFKPILKESLILAWQKKTWWIVGFFALFLSGTIGYQYVLQGVNTLTSPSEFLLNLEFYKSLLTMDIIQGQWKILTSNTDAFFIIIAVWAVVLAVFFILYLLSVYAVTLLVAHAKNYELKGTLSVFLAIKESVYHYKSVFAVVILMILVSNTVLFLLGLPVLWVSLNHMGALTAVATGLLITLFLILSFMLLMTGIYSINYIVIEDYTFKAALKAGWNFFLRYWLVNIEMFLLQLLITIAAGFVVFFISSLIIIPLVILGMILVANQQFALTQYLPQIAIGLSAVIFTIFGSVYTVFQMYCWSLMFMRLEKANPRSRLAYFFEIGIFR